MEYNFNKALKFNKEMQEHVIIQLAIACINKDYGRVAILNTQLRDVKEAYCTLFKANAHTEEISHAMNARANL